MQDICYDPQTSGGLLIALPEKEAAQCLERLKDEIPEAAIIGYVTEQEEASVMME